MNDRGLRVCCALDSPEVPDIRLDRSQIFARPHPIQNGNVTARCKFCTHESSELAGTSGDENFAHQNTMVRGDRDGRGRS